MNQMTEGDILKVKLIMKRLANFYKEGKLSALEFQRQYKLAWDSFPRPKGNNV